MDELRQRLKTIDGGRVLDVGTGRGQFVRILMDSLDDYESITGVDTVDPATSISPDLLGCDGLNWLQCDAGALPFDDGHFDMVCIAFTLHHLDPPQVGAVLGEMKRVLKPGGLFLLAEMYRDGQQSEAQMSHVLFHHWGAEVDRLLGARHFPTMDREDVVRTARCIGLTGLTIFDDVEKKEDVKDEDELNRIAEHMDRYIASLEGHPEFERMKSEAEAIKCRIRNVGIAGAAALVAIGAKP
jgi:SAM-dependent methyltransferase